MWGTGRRWSKRSVFCSPSRDQAGGGTWAGPEGAPGQKEVMPGLASPRPRVADRGLPPRLLFQAEVPRCLCPQANHCIQDQPERPCDSSCHLQGFEDPPGLEPRATLLLSVPALPAPTDVGLPTTGSQGQSPRPASPTSRSLACLQLTRRP